LIREGSYTLEASTIVPSKTLPAPASMLTGQPLERHGVPGNTVVTPLNPGTAHTDLALRVS